MEGRLAHEYGLLLNEVTTQSLCYADIASLSEVHLILWLQAEETDSW